MDRSLDEIISERPRGSRPPAEPRKGPPPRASRREEYPRDGIRKNRTDERVNIDSDWVHDRFEGDRYERLNKRPPPEDDRYAGAARPSATNGTKVRVDNVHYDLTEDDLRELFERIGPTVQVKVQYDRHDRSTGTAYVTYGDYRDARAAIVEYDGQNANGMPIKLSIVPTEPRGAPAKGGSLFDRIERPPRSLFDRMEGGPADREDSRDDGRRRMRGRSDSPRTSKPIPEHIDRYIPGQRGSRSPVRRRGTPREPGRRPGARRDDGAREPRRGKMDVDGRPLVGGRPRKTAEELDAEMEDYWGAKSDEKANGAAAAVKNGTSSTTAAAATVADDDIDMIE